ncbi:MAG: DUF177 domain-containing protein [Tannerella sp.]|nr:DUF177 domain-containing protein [Tannerella sp.]
MGKFDAYQIDFKNMTPGEVRKHEYPLDNLFFRLIEGDELQKGKVTVLLTVECKPSCFVLRFRIEGVATVSCDRCLDEMEVAVKSDNRLIVKLGREYAEENDETLIISEEESSLNLAWFLYEFVALAIPMRHIHPPGKCNKAMSVKLKKHSAKSRDDNEDGASRDGYEAEESAEASDDGGQEPEATDPRWDKLKDIKEKIN